MNRNVTILIIILTVVLLSFYLVWLRGKFQVTQTLVSPSPKYQVLPSPSPSPTVSPTVSPTPIATASAIPTKPTATPKTSTPAGKVVQ